MKNVVKYQAESFAGVSIALLAFGFLASEGNRIVLFTVSALFGFGMLILILSIKFKSTWLIKTTEQLSTVRASHLTIFLALTGLTLIVWQQQQVVFGIVVLYVAYLLLGTFIGIDAGNILIKIYYRFYHKKWNVKQAATLMGISRSRVRKLLVEGRIIGEKENNTWVVLKLGYKRKNPGRRNK